MRWPRRKPDTELLNQLVAYTEISVTHPDETTPAPGDEDERKQEP